MSGLLVAEGLGSGPVAQSPTALADGARRLQEALGSADVDLMQRLVDVLARTDHRVIVSKGPLADQITLHDNQTGEGFLPQPAILPMADLVITHGGNNTVTEAFHHGKPMIVFPLFWDQVDNAQRVVVLTGAGISAESGLATFRDAQTGLWATYRPEDLATPAAFVRNPRLVWDWYAWRREHAAQAQPNSGHLALVALARYAPMLTLITQNVDSLHQRNQQILAGGALFLAFVNAAFAIGQWHELRAAEPSEARGHRAPTDVVPEPAGSGGDPAGQGTTLRRRR